MASERMRRRVLETYKRLGGNGRAVARALGVGATTVYRVLESEGISLPPPSQAHPHRFSPDVEAEIARRYASGERSGPLRREFGCTAELIRDIVKRSGGDVTTRGGQRRRYSDEDFARMKEMLAAGKSQTEIAIEFGTIQSSISAFLRSRGIRAARAEGPDHGMWKGGRTWTGDGYLRVFVAHDDPMACMRSASGYVLEHRLVMARKLGRALLPTETVHHINGKRDDNRPDNLELWDSRHPRGERVTGLHCPTCTCCKEAP